MACRHTYDGRIGLICSCSCCAGCQVAYRITIACCGAEGRQDLGRTGDDGWTDGGVSMTFEAGWRRVRGCLAFQPYCKYNLQY